MTKQKYNITTYEKIHLRTIVEEHLVVRNLWWVDVNWKPLLAQTYTKNGLQYLRPTEYNAILNIHMGTFIARDSVTPTS